MLAAFRRGRVLAAHGTTHGHGLTHDIDLTQNRMIYT
jgi:hypothetical protein